MILYNGIFCFVNIFIILTNKDNIELIYNEVNYKCSDDKQFNVSFATVTSSFSCRKFAESIWVQEIFHHFNVRNVPSLNIAFCFKKVQISLAATRYR